LLIPAALIIGLMVWLIFRGTDVRLALLLAAGALATMAGDLRPVIYKFLATFSDERFVVPICSAMGFVYVLRLTQCDQHLVHLLIRPLRRSRVLLIPGVVVTGFLVNIPVISQSSTAVCLGAVVAPLMRAAGISPITVGAALLLGTSIGGELLNPGAPELNTVAERLSTQDRPVKPQEIVPAVSRLIIYHLAIATAIFWWRSSRYERNVARTKRGDNLCRDDAGAKFRVNYFRAMIPVIPLLILFATGPPLNLFTIPFDWVVDEKSRSAFGTRQIGLAMLVGVAFATLAAPRQATGVVKAFCEGAGYAFATIISLIVAASCFGAAIEQIGLARWLDRLIHGAPDLLTPVAASVSLGFAVLCGSGMAATQSLYGLFVTPAEQTGLDRFDLGALVSVSAATGRTMSPVAVVSLLCGSMTATSSFALAKRVAGPLLVSWAIVVALRMMGLI
jgi:C4-dicarboxylate transporter, DcuC family